VNDEMTDLEEFLRVAPLGWVPAGWWADLDPGEPIPFVVTDAGRAVVEGAK
jgi:hypothetical protein